MILDAHAHIFPHKICHAATDGIAAFYNISIPYDGTAETLIRLGSDAGVSRFLVQSVATVPEQVPSINRFIIDSVRQYPEKFIGFMALHPNFSDIEGEIVRAEQNHLKGIKLHPDFQKFQIDNPAVYPIYEIAQGRLPILIHMGDPRYAYSKPERLANVLDKFPRLQVIAAHFGGWSEWDDAEKYLKNHRLWVDSSSTSHWVSPRRLRALIDSFGTDSVLFGTDYPMWNHKDELRALEQLSLPSSAMDRILYKNAAELLNLQ